MRRNTLSYGCLEGGASDRNCAIDEPQGGDSLGAKAMETTMDLSFITRYFRSRQVYWNVVRELSEYTDRELQDIGIDRADIPRIALEASHG